VKNMSRLFVLLIGLGMLCSCRQRITSSMISEAPIKIDSDWVQIALPQTTIAQWQSQEIRLTSATPFEPSTNPWGLKLKDGSIAVLELKVVAEERKEYVLDFDGFALSESDEILFESNKIPQGTRLTQLRIRCTQPLVVSKIAWISYMPSDTKTGVP